MRSNAPSNLWLIVFVSLLHAGFFCVAWPALITRDATVDVAGGNAGDGGGGGMGFVNPGDGHAPARADALLPAGNSLAAEMGASLEQSIEHWKSEARELAAEVERNPQFSGDANQSSGAEQDLPVVIGPAFESAPVVPVNPHRAEVEHALAMRGRGDGASAAKGQAEAGDPRASAGGGGASAAGSAPDGGSVNGTFGSIDGTASSGGGRATAAGAATGGSAVGDAGGPVGSLGAVGASGFGGGGAVGLRITYPAESRRRGEEGTVVLRIVILPNGRAGRVDVVTSSGASRLDRAAIDGALNGRFSPALNEGQPVASVVQRSVLFKLVESGR